MRLANNDRLREATKERRTYLSKKAALQTQAGIGLAIAVVFGCLTVYSGVLVFLIWSKHADMALSYVVCALVFLVITAIGWNVRQSKAAKARQLPIVPPVQEQIEALPADEILVRGSEAPAAGAQELLRSVEATPELSNSELLRPGTPGCSAEHD